MTEHAAHPSHQSHGHDHDQLGFLPAMGHDQLLPLYDLFTRLAGARAVYRYLVDAASIGWEQDVLDVGSGTGSVALLVKKLYRTANVTGLDPDPKAIALSARKARRRGLAVRWDQGFAGELPYPDASQDRVLSSMMFHHLDEDEKVPALREVRRVLRPGGELYLMDFVGGSGHSRVSERVVGADEKIPEAMRAAGFADVARIGTRRMHLGLGTCAVFRAR
ncbi:class I SAM-dependent methyltransferase [Antribacter gilvus]|uniref:class I SAM-dependent methyltransferase n=1 Tax=Antribacter gilvus TaxID=2304675 RepID=UPI0013DFAE56|nr:class I SAM-dependent methyltransferase [Antribacter gilvus]